MAKMQFTHLNSPDDSFQHQVITFTGDLPAQTPQEERESAESDISAKSPAYSFKRGNRTTVLIKAIDPSDAGLERLRQAAAKHTAGLKGKVWVSCADIPSDMALAILEGIALGAYDFQVHKSEKKEGITQIGTDFDQVQLESLSSLVDSVCFARDLVNEPANVINVAGFIQRTKEEFAGTKAKLQILEKTQLETLKMGGILAVNKGSVDPAAMICIEWKPENAVNSKPFTLVGKGVVYDTGGLSLKPTPNSMDLMKSDMGGAATVVAASLHVIKQELPIHLVTLIPLTDNRPGGNAYAPGDVIKMFDGTTVEVLNTDAEGRMILADALAYAKKWEPDLTMSFATLTGAAVRAVGEIATCMMPATDEDTVSTLESCGYRTHERVVRMPMWDDYLEEMKSDIADLKNIGGPYAGMVTAAKFLEHFAPENYVHMDIAGPAFPSKGAGYIKKGGSGVGVRFLDTFITKHYLNA